MRKFRRIKYSSKYSVGDIYYFGDCDRYDPRCWEEVFDKPKLFKLP